MNPLRQLGANLGSGDDTETVCRPPEQLGADDACTDQHGDATLYRDLNASQRPGDARPTSVPN